MVEKNPEKVYEKPIRVLSKVGFDMATTDEHRYLHFISTQYFSYIGRLEEWAKINSFSYSLAGLNQMLETLEEAFAPLGATVSRHELPDQSQLGSDGTVKSLPLGKALVFEKRPEAPIQILLAGHMDTVYPPEQEFPVHFYPEEEKMEGPGVCDMKGGLLIMLIALTALEKFDHSSKIGWKVLINPDEEIGTTGSRALLLELAEKCDLALIFEPSLPDGSLVSARKGSARYSVFIKGKSAHVGRNYSEGRHAIYALGAFIIEIENLSKQREGLIISVGYIEGGGMTNIVPEKAYCQISVRADTAEDFQFVDEAIKKLDREFTQTREVAITISCDSYRPPKPFTKNTEALFDLFANCAKDLDIPFNLQSTGGVCDGNIIAPIGIPTIDTLGAVGGNLHTSKEYIDLSSLTQRAQLTTLFLFKLASGELEHKNE